MCVRNHYNGSPQTFDTSTNHVQDEFEKRPSLSGHASLLQFNINFPRHWSTRLSKPTTQMSFTLRKGSVIRVLVSQVNTDLVEEPLLDQQRFVHILEAPSETLAATNVGIIFRCFVLFSRSPITHTRHPCPSSSDSGASRLPTAWHIRRDNPR